MVPDRLGQARIHILGVHVSCLNAEWPSMAFLLCLPPTLLVVGRRGPALRLWRRFDGATVAG